MRLLRVLVYIEHTRFFIRKLVTIQVLDRMLATKPTSVCYARVKVRELAMYSSVRIR